MAIVKMDVKQGFMDIHATFHVAWGVLIINVMRMEIVSADVERGFMDISAIANVEKDAMLHVRQMVSVTVKRGGNIGIVTVS